jgi:hypothetical protein
MVVRAGLPIWAGLPCWAAHKAQQVVELVVRLVRLAGQWQGC